MLDKIFKSKETYVPEEEELKAAEEPKEEKVPYLYEVHFKGDDDPIVYVWADEFVSSPFSGLFEFKLDGEIVAMIAEREILYWIRTYD